MGETGEGSGGEGTGNAVPPVHHLIYSNFYWFESDINVLQTFLHNGLWKGFSGK